MEGINGVQVISVIGVCLIALLLGRWIGKRRTPTDESDSPQRSSAHKVKFFISAKDRDTTLFMVLCFATVWMLARWFEEHIDVATVSLVLGSLITVIITMGAALYPEGNNEDDT